MSQTTPSWIILPTAAEIMAANGSITVQIYPTLAAVQIAATLAALASGQDRTIYQALSYASATPASASVTAQLNTIPQS